MNKLSIDAKHTPNGFEFKFLGQKYLIYYPDKKLQSARAEKVREDELYPRVQENQLEFTMRF